VPYFSDGFVEIWLFNRFPMGKFPALQETKKKGEWRKNGNHVASGHVEGITSLHFTPISHKTYDYTKRKKAEK